MSLIVKCPTCDGDCGRVGTGQWRCPKCDVPGANAVCGRCDGVVPQSLTTSWHGEGYAEVVCFGCAKQLAESVGVLERAG